MTVSVLAFARLRELLGFAKTAMDLPDGARVGDAWRALAASEPAIAPLRASTRLARNGALADDAAELHEGDELALLPPAGGG